MASKTNDYLWDGERHKVPERDTQRAKLYEAERVAFGEDFTRVIGDGSMEAVEEFVRRVESSQTWINLLANSGRTPIKGGLRLRDGRRNRSASANAFELTLPRWSRTAPIVLHEMAHAATPGGGHNWPFAAAYLILVGRFVSAEARDKLKAQFRKDKVRFAPPRKFSPEHLAKLRAQGFKLAAARQGPKPAVGELTPEMIQAGTVVFHVTRAKSDAPFEVVRKVAKGPVTHVTWAPDGPVVSWESGYGVRFDAGRMFPAEAPALERAAQLNRERAQLLLAAAARQLLVAAAARGES